jgi:hypothetical protein
MISAYTKKQLFFIFFFSLTAIALWLGEILFIKGWHGLSWLHGSLYSPYLSTLFVVAAFLTPFVADNSLTKKNAGIAFCLLYLISIIFYWLGRIVACFPYMYLFWTTAQYYLMNFLGLLLFPLFAICYWFITQKFIRKTKKIHILYLTLFSLAVLPLSMMSIWICPGFGAGDGEIDAVKMGYPVFWMAMMVGLAGLLMKGDNYEL